MIKGFLLGSLFAGLSLIAYLAVHLGFFEPVRITEEIRGPYHLLFEDHRGSYFKIAELIDRVERDVKSKNLDCGKTFGEYFDNPSEVDEDRLRSRAGCLNENPYPATPPYQSAELPAQKFVVAHFNGSPAIGPWKVYPKAKAYIEQHHLNRRGESLEIYSRSGESISTEYLFGLD